MQIIPLEGEAFFISAIILILGAGFFFSLLITLFLAKNALSQGITFEINGNKFTDTDVKIDYNL